MRQHVGHLVGDRVGIDRHRHGAERLAGAHRPIEPRPIAADDGEFVAALEPELGKADARRRGPPRASAPRSRSARCRDPYGAWRDATPSAAALWRRSLGSVSKLRIKRLHAFPPPAFCGMRVCRSTRASRNRGRRTPQLSSDAAEPQPGPGSPPPARRESAPQFPPHRSHRRLVVSPNARANSRIAGRKRQCYFTPRNLVILTRKCPQAPNSPRKTDPGGRLPCSMYRSGAATRIFSLGEDQIAVRDMARSFAAEVFAPHALAWDEAKHFPVAEMRQAAALGMGGVYIAPEVGGSALSRLDATLDLRGAGHRLSDRRRPTCRSTTWRPG